MSLATKPSKKNLSSSRMPRKLTLCACLLISLLPSACAMKETLQSAEKEINLTCTRHVTKPVMSSLLRDTGVCSFCGSYGLYDPELGDLPDSASWFEGKTDQTELTRFLRVSSSKSSARRTVTFHESLDAEPTYWGYLTADGTFERLALAFDFTLRKNTLKGMVPRAASAWLNGPYSLQSPVLWADHLPNDWLLFRQDNGSKNHEACYLLVNGTTRVLAIKTGKPGNRCQFISENGGDWEKLWDADAMGLKRNPLRNSRVWEKKFNQFFYSTTTEKDQGPQNVSKGRLA